jgi:hypothetical protein
MDINVQIRSIIVNDNIVNNGQLSMGEFRMDFNPFVNLNNIDRISIRWTIQMNINASQHCIHRSTTVFECPSLPIDSNILNDMRIDLLMELGQISQAHSRALFVELNNSENIPMFNWAGHLRNQIVRELQSYLN